MRPRATRRAIRRVCHGSCAPHHIALIQTAAVSALHQCIQLLIKAGNFRQAADREKEVRLCGLMRTPSSSMSDCSNLRSGRIGSGKGSGQLRPSWRVVQARGCECVSLPMLSGLQAHGSRTANQCYQQAAELSAELQDYQRSMELYCIVADWSLTSALTKYSVKEYWLRAALCSMAMGVSGFLISKFCLPLEG